MKSQIDALWNCIHTGGITNPLEVIKQITYLLFIKRLDDIQIAQENLARRLGRPLTDSIYDPSDPNQQTLRWSRFMQLPPDQKYLLVRDQVFPFMQQIGDRGSTFARYMQKAYLAVPNAAVLDQITSMISALDTTDQDTQGDVYEYMLSKLATSGTAGQFRTPRHIAQMMTQLMQPHYTDTICDPACGTAGFLVTAGEYLRKHYTIDTFSQGGGTTYEDFLRRYRSEIFHGCEFDPTMIGIAAMNLMLHGIEEPGLYDQSSLEDEYTVADRYSLVLANPPFKGRLNEQTIAPSLQKRAKTKKSELLFLTLILRILRVGGRCATIVPDGVLFATDRAACSIRQMIIDDHQLQAVISMPSGIFKPYAGVSTAILIFRRTDSGGTDTVWFYDMQADGFSLDDKRRVVELNDIPDILNRWHHLDAEKSRSRTDQSFLVPVDEIRRNKYDLSINRYKQAIQEYKQYDSPDEIIARLRTLDTEVTALTTAIAQSLKNNPQDV